MHNNIIAHAGSIMAAPPPSYKEALDIDSEKASNKLQQPPHEIALVTLRGNSSEVDGSDTSVHHVALETATLQHPSDTVHDHEVAVAQPTGTGASRELSLICATLWLIKSKPHESMHIWYKTPLIYSIPNIVWRDSEGEKVIGGRKGDQNLNGPFEIRKYEFWWLPLTTWDDNMYYYAAVTWQLRT